MSVSASRPSEKERNYSDASECLVYRRMNEAFNQTSKFTRTAGRTILQDALEQLQILRNLNNINAIDFELKPVEYQTVDKRFTGKEDHAHARLPSVGTSYDKMAKDINMLINILRETSTEMRFGQNYLMLNYCLKALHTMAADDKWLLECRAKNGLEIKKLKNPYTKERKAGIKATDGTCENIQSIQFATENARAYGRLKLDYFNKWEATRMQQNDQVCREKEEFFTNIINETQEKLQTEIKCHKQFDDYIEESKNDMLDEINYWLKHYDDEIDSREDEIIKMKGKLEQLTIQHNEVLAENGKRQKDMAEWKEYKKRGEIKRKRAKVERWASVIIQSWWRGIMVTKRLGPYKRGKGKGKGKSKK